MIATLHYNPTYYHKPRLYS